MQTVEQIIDRARRREGHLWPQFKYAVVPTAKNPAVLGLYSYQGENALVFLKELSTEELAALADGFTIKMLDLTNDEAVVALKIATEQYRAQVKAVSLAAARTTKRLKIEADLAEVQAQIDGLAADSAALANLRYEGETRRQKMLVEIEELTARIAEEGLAKKLAEEEALRKALAVEQAKLERMMIGLSVLEVQQKINQVALDSARIDNEVLEWQNRIAAVAVERLGIANADAELQQDIIKATLAGRETDLDISETLLRIENVITERTGVAVDMQRVNNRVAEITKDMLGITLTGKELDRAITEALYAAMKVALNVQEADRRIVEAQTQIAASNIDVTEAQARRIAALLERRKADTQALEIARRYVEASIEGKEITTRGIKLSAGLTDADTANLSLAVDGKEQEARQAEIRIRELADDVDAAELAARNKGLQVAAGAVDIDVSEAARRLVDANADIAGVSNDAIRLANDRQRMQNSLDLLEIEDIQYAAALVGIETAQERNAAAEAESAGLYARSLTSLADSIAWEAERLTLAETLRTWRKANLWQNHKSSLMQAATRIAELERFTTLASTIGQRDQEYAEYQRAQWEGEIKPVLATEWVQKLRRIINAAKGAAQAAANLCDAKIDGFLSIDD